jgi:hypothetical protein
VAVGYATHNKVSTHRATRITLEERECFINNSLSTQG